MRSCVFTTVPFSMRYWERSNFIRGGAGAVMIDRCITGKEESVCVREGNAPRRKNGRLPEQA